MAAFVCLVHYHEIGLKGNNRSTFEHKLIDNLRATLKGLPVSSVERISGHLLVRLAPAADYDAAMTVYGRIRQTPGVARVSFARCCEVSSEQYCEAAYLELAASGDFESFKVDSRRSNTNIALNSLDLNREVGSYLCERFPDKVVRMKGQDRTVHVYVIQGSVYVYVKTDEGVGGLPVGSAGKVISLLSSGIDSPVASWRMLRRGAIVVGLHFSGRPQTSDTSEWLVQDIIEKLSPAGGFGRLYVVPFGDIQRRIARAVPDDLRIIMYRRMMFSFACRLSAIEHAKALVTGESLGQVASQTLDNLAATSDSVKMQIFRPLIGCDKLEIIEDAKKLGTFEISSQDAPDCCTLFMPRAPETHAKLRDVYDAEADLPFDEWSDEIMDALEVHDYRCPQSYFGKKAKEN